MKKRGSDEFRPGPDGQPLAWDEPPAQDAELAALLARVAQAGDIPEPLVVALSQLLRFLYRQEALAAGEPSAEE